jgi:hypothetical protein
MDYGGEQMLNQITNFVLSEIALMGHHLCINFYLLSYYFCFLILLTNEFTVSHSVCSRNLAPPHMSNLCNLLPSDRLPSCNLNNSVNHTISQKVINDLIDCIPCLFDLPQDAKNKIFMANSPHFLEYSKLGAGQDRL